MNFNLILAESDFHLIQACSFSLNKEEKVISEILWLGNKDSIYFNFFKNKFKITYLDLRSLNFFNVENISKNSKIISLKETKIDRLVTFYDTHFFSNT